MLHRDERCASIHVLPRASIPIHPDALSVPMSDRLIETDKIDSWVNWVVWSMSRRSQATLSIRFLMKSRWNGLDLHVTRAGLVVRLPQYL